MNINSIRTMDFHAEAIYYHELATISKSNNIENSKELFRKAFQFERMALIKFIIESNTEPRKSALIKSVAYLAFSSALYKHVKYIVNLGLEGNPNEEIKKQLNALLFLNNSHQKQTSKPYIINTSNNKISYEIKIEDYLEKVTNYSTSFGYDLNDFKTKIKDGDKEALELYIKFIFRHVFSMSKQYKYQGLSDEEVLVAGVKGAIGAIERYDPTKKRQFLAMMLWFIRQSILSELAKYSKEVRLQLDKFSNIFGDTFNENISEEYPDQIKARIKSYPDVLSVRQLDVINLYFGLGEEQAMTLEEIGAKFGLTRERTRQIKDKAVRKLKLQEPVNEAIALVKNNLDLK